MLPPNSHLRSRVISSNAITGIIYAPCLWVSLGFRSITRGRHNKISSPKTIKKMGRTWIFWNSNPAHWPLRRWATSTGPRCARARRPCGPRPPGEAATKQRPSLVRVWHWLMANYGTIWYSWKQNGSLDCQDHSKCRIQFLYLTFTKYHNLSKPILTQILLHNKRQWLPLKLGTKFSFRGSSFPFKASILNDENFTKMSKCKHEQE